MVSDVNAQPEPNHEPRRLTAEVLGAPDPALREEWRALAVARETPYVLPEWHETWLETHPGDRPVVVVARRADGALAGVVPLVAPADGRWLTAAGAPFADWFCPAAAPEDDVALAAAVARVAGDLPAPWRIDRALGARPLARRAAGPRPSRSATGGCARARSAASSR